MNAPPTVPSHRPASNAFPNQTGVADYVQKLSAAAPPLSDEQRTRLAELLKPVRTGDGAA